MRVTFTVTAGGGSVTGGTSTTDENGIASVGSWTLGTAAGATNSLTATVPGVVGASVVFTATASAASAMRLVIVSGDNQVKTDGGQLVNDPTVKAVDQFGNGVGGVPVTFTVTAGGGSVYTGPDYKPSTATTVPSLTDGTASAHWALAPFGGAATLRASAAGVASAQVDFSAKAVPSQELVEQLMVNGIQQWVNTFEGLNASGPLNTQARSYSASWNNFNLNFYSSIDNAQAPPDQWTRYTRAWQNDPAAAERTSVSWLWSGGTGGTGNGTAAQGFYGALDMANLVLKAVRAGGVVFRSSSDSKRAEAMALFLQGAALGQIALNYDRGFIIDENAIAGSTPSYSSRRAVRDFAVAKLIEAATLAGANGFSVPVSWTGGYAYSSTAVAQMAHTLAALTLAYYPRTAAENATVDWVQVAAHAAAGLSSGSPLDLVFGGDGCYMWCPELLMWANSMDTFRVHTRLAWLLDPTTQQDPWPGASGNPRPNSPDRRLGDGSFGSSQMIAGFGNFPRTSAGGTDFAWSSQAIFNSSRGDYHQSNIAHIRYDRSASQDPSGIYGAYGPFPVVSATQNDLVWAEALLRSGGSSAIAASLINRTRVTRGGLSPASPGDGVGADQLGPCTAVGRMAIDGTTRCTLMAMLLYEKEVELLGLGASTFLEQRRVPLVVAGGRVIQGLLPGTPREMPVPYSILVSRGEPLYTWGGFGQANSSPP